MPGTSANNDIDLSFLFDIADGSDEFIVDSIGMFLELTPGLIQEVTIAINKRDWAVAATAVHKLKPNLGFFGMLNSQALIQDVELLCKSGSPSPQDVDMLFNEVKEMIENGMVALAQVRDEKAAGL